MLPWFVSFSLRHEYYLLPLSSLLPGAGEYRRERLALLFVRGVWALPGLADTEKA
jgi:hypothetical protein